MQASAGHLPTSPASLHLGGSTSSLPPDLSPHVGDSSGEQSVDTPSPPQLARLYETKHNESPSPAIRLRKHSNDLLSSGREGVQGRISVQSDARPDVDWPHAARSFDKRRRTRVISTATNSSLRSIPGTGFPYRNSAALLNANAGWPGEGWNAGGSGDNDSSESGDVDLDLTLAWEGRGPHVGIDMTELPIHHGDQTLAAPAVIRSSHSWERGADPNYGAGWSFRPTEPLRSLPEPESREGRNRQHSWHGFLGAALKSPTWSTSGSSTSAGPSRRGSRVDSTQGRTTAATSPQSLFFSPHLHPKQPDAPGAHHPLESTRQAAHEAPHPSPSLHLRLINAFRDSLQSPQTPANRGLGIQLSSSPSSPVPEVSISSPDGHTQSHVRWAKSPAKVPHIFRPKHLLLASKAQTQVKTDNSASGYRPMLLDYERGSYRPPSPSSPCVSPRLGSPISGESSRSASPQLQQSWTEPLPWYDERSPAEWLFLLGFCGPWLWWIGAFFLRAEDGELFGTRGVICRCRRGCLCLAMKRTELRLAGIPDSGRGTVTDAIASRRARDIPHVGCDGWVRANRAAVGVSSIVITAICAVALQAIVRAW